jgi:hypothetical protein
MPPVGFELTISTGELPQTYAVHRAAIVKDEFLFTRPVCEQETAFIGRCWIYSKTCLKRNAIVPVFFSVFTGFRLTKGCVLIKRSTKNMIA